MDNQKIKELLALIEKNQKSLNDDILLIKELLNDDNNLVSNEEMIMILNTIYEQQVFKKVMIPVIIKDSINDNCTEIFINDKKYKIECDIDLFNDSLIENYNVALIELNDTLHYLIPHSCKICFDCKHSTFRFVLNELNYNEIFDNDFEFCNHKFWNIDIIDNVMNEIKASLIEKMDQECYCELQHLHL